MKTVEKHLEDASAEVHRQIGQVPDREPKSLYRRAHKRRVAVTAGSVVLAATVLVFPVVLFTSEPETGPAASQPSASELGDEITFEQYETAYTGFVECLRNTGYTVEGPLQFGRDANAPLPLYVGIDPTIYLQRLVIGDVEKGPLDAADAECQETHLGDIEDLWFEQEGSKFLSEREWIDNLLACAEVSGIEIPDSLSYDEMLNEVGTDPSDQILADIAGEAIMSHGCRPWEG